MAARVVLVTHPVRGARAYARALVELGHAACVNLTGVESVYRWKGRVEAARERLLVVKTSARALARLERHVRATHPYECFEFVVLTPARVERRYLAWLEAETRA
jgi:periplasmic divalent cation tolerance protein